MGMRFGLLIWVGEMLFVRLLCWLVANTSLYDRWSLRAPYLFDLCWGWGFGFGFGFLLAGVLYLCILGPSRFAARTRSWWWPNFRPFSELIARNEASLVWN